MRAVDVGQGVVDVFVDANGEFALFAHHGGELLENAAELGDGALDVLQSLLPRIGVGGVLIVKLHLTLRLHHRRPRNACARRARARHERVRVPLQVAESARAFSHGARKRVVAEVVQPTIERARSRARAKHRPSFFSSLDVRLSRRQCLLKRLRRRRQSILQRIHHRDAVIARRLIRLPSLSRPRRRALQFNYGFIQRLNVQLDHRARLRYLSRFIVVQRRRLRELIEPFELQRRSMNSVPDRRRHLIRVATHRSRVRRQSRVLETLVRARRRRVVLRRAFALE